MSTHPVAALIRARRSARSRPGARDDEAVLALVIEGGGMRGAISGGMAMGLEDRGLRDAFDHVYGASAGTLNGAWFVAGAARAGLPAWSDPELRTAGVRRSNLLRGRPLVDGRYLTDVVYEQLTPMPFGDVIDSPVRFHPVATDAATGQAGDLGPLITGVAELKLALRASTGLPLLSGRPVRLGERRWFDAGLSAAIPYRMALEQGATHVLVLRSRRAGEQESSDRGLAAAVAVRYLRRHSPALAAAFLERPARIVNDDDELERLEADGTALSLRPSARTTPIGRLERDHQVVLAGLRAGEDAVASVFGA